MLREGVQQSESAHFEAEGSLDALGQFRIKKARHELLRHILITIIVHLNDALVKTTPRKGIQG